MNEKIALIKTGQKEHMESLLHKGEIYMNSLQYFKNLGHSSNRSDKFEGLDFTFPGFKDVLQVEIEGNFRSIPGISVVGIRNNKKSPNIFCLHAVREKQSIKELKIDKFGSWGILFKDFPEFLLRLKKKYDKFTFEYSLVTYFDKKSYMGEMNYFRKYSEYADEQEFRIIAFPGSQNAITFQIGNISDIATLIKIKDIQKNWFY